MGLEAAEAISKNFARQLERETGIEPASLAWKARVLPLNYSRTGFLAFAKLVKMTSHSLNLVEGTGFEPV